MGLLGMAIDVPFRVFTKEVAEQFRARGYVGFLAHITWFLWVVAGTSGLLAAAALWQRDRKDRRIRFFLATTALTALLLLDDFVMLHEWIPTEELLYLAYALMLAGLLLWFRPQFVRAGALLAVLAGALWAVSIGADFIQETWDLDSYVIEDGAKIMGTALWAAFMFWGCLAVVNERPLGPRRAVGEGQAAGEGDTRPAALDEAE
jgi:hypothetical protein